MGIRSFNIYDGVQSVVASVWQGENVLVQLHKTVVFSKNKDKIILSSGGWKTNSTKTIINKCFNQLNIKGYLYQKKGVWYVDYNDSADSFKTVEFKDGIKIKVGL